MPAGGDGDESENDVDDKNVCSVGPVVFVVPLKVVIFCVLWSFSLVRKHQHGKSKQLLLRQTKQHRKGLMPRLPTTCRANQTNEQIMSASRAGSSIVGSDRVWCDHASSNDLRNFNMRSRRHARVRYFFFVVSSGVLPFCVSKVTFGNISVSSNSENVGGKCQLEVCVAGARAQYDTKKAPQCASGAVIVFCNDVAMVRFAQTRVLVKAERATEHEKKAKQTILHKTTAWRELETTPAQHCRQTRMRESTSSLIDATYRGKLGRCTSNREACDVTRITKPRLVGYTHNT